MAQSAVRAAGGGPRTLGGSGWGLGGRDAVMLPGPPLLSPERLPADAVGEASEEAPVVVRDLQGCGGRWIQGPDLTVKEGQSWDAACSWGTPGDRLRRRPQRPLREEMNALALPQITT